MIKFYQIPDETKERIYKNTGEKNNLPAYAIEKDWWVAQTLLFTVLRSKASGNSFE